MNLARSTYYYQLKNRNKILAREQSDVEIKNLIDNVHIEFPYYGYRMLHAELARRGHLINEKKIRRLQSKFGLFAIMVRRYVRTTDSNHVHRIYPNLLKPKPLITGLNEVWVSDITYVRISSGFVFAAIVMDLCSRKVVGYAISKRIDRELTLGALRMAIELRRPDVGLIHHSDRGVQYACDDYIALMEEWKMRPSMSRRGNPYDNAFMESFMKTLKYNEVYLNHYETWNDVLNRIPEFIEEVYNKKRMHSSLGYLTPEEFELNIQNRKAETHLNLTD
jgi:putative transposase